jgi:hypothetical protein
VWAFGEEAPEGLPSAHTFTKALDTHKFIWGMVLFIGCREGEEESFYAQYIFEECGGRKCSPGYTSLSATVAARFAGWSGGIVYAGTPP